MSTEAVTVGQPVHTERFTLVDQLLVSCLWFAYNVQWGALLFVVLPSQIEAMAGPDRKELWLGIVLPIGAFVSLVVTPVAGALSDRCRHPAGRRRPFLIAGIGLSVLFLLLMAGFGPGSPIWLFAVCLAGLQFACNWWGGPYAGLIPDVVPKPFVGRASGFQALMTALGTIAGVVLGALLSRGGSYWPIYGFISGTLVVLLLLTVKGVREKPLATDPGPFRVGEFLGSFLPDPKKHRSFYWVLITRAFVCMGVYSVSNYFQYFLKDVIRVSDPAGATSLLMTIIIGMGIPTSVLAGSLSDRYGRKPLVYASGALMSLACAIYIAVAFFPNLPFTLVVGALFGIGNGAYLAVDWALAIDVLPEGEGAAKDMGIWHVALVLPQVIAPAITGLTLDALKDSHGLLIGYSVVFAMAAVWFILGTVFVRQVRGVR